MEVRLAVQHEKANTRQVRLGPETVIGRAPECQLRIASTEVSRRHCRIQIKDRTICIRDLGSANGTFLNGQQIPPSLNVQIVDGDTLRIGPIQFLVQCAGSGAEIPAPPVAGTPEDLSDTADNFENVRVINAEDETSDSADEHLPLLPVPDDRRRPPVPPADDDDTRVRSTGKRRSTDDDSGPIPGGATIYDRALPQSSRRSVPGQEIPGRKKPAGAAPRSGEQFRSKEKSSGSVKAAKPTTPPPDKRSGSSTEIPPLADSDSDSQPPANLLGALGLLEDDDPPAKRKPAPPKRPQAPPRVEPDDLDLTLRTDDDDHSSNDATIHQPDAPSKKRPDPARKTASHILADEPPKKPGKQAPRKSSSGQPSDSSIPSSRDEDDQALADFLRGFEN